MLKYSDLTEVEQKMVNDEIRSNYSASSKVNNEFKRISNNVHNDLACCNCFRLEKNCCCDTIKGCIDDDGDTDYTEEAE